MNNAINFARKLVSSRAVSVLLFLFNFMVIFKRTFDVSLFYSMNYIFINKSAHICSTYILTFNLSHEVARFFFISSSTCRNFFFLFNFLHEFFFLDLTPPLPGYLMVHPLLRCVHVTRSMLSEIRNNAK